MFENPPEDNSRPITLLCLARNNVEGENLTLALKGSMNAVVCG